MTPNTLILFDGLNLWPEVSKKKEEFSFTACRVPKSENSVFEGFIFKEFTLSHISMDMRDSSRRTLREAMLVLSFGELSKS